MFYTIDSENNVTAHATAEEAAATTTTPFDTFASEQELAELAAGWPAERLLAILNSLPGEKPAKKLKDPKTAVSRIWARIQSLDKSVDGKAEQPKARAALPSPKPLETGAFSCCFPTCTVSLSRSDRFRLKPRQSQRARHAPRRPVPASVNADLAPDRLDQFG